MSDEPLTIDAISRAVENVIPICEYDNATVTEIRYLQDQVGWLVTLVEMMAKRMGIDVDAYYDDET